MNHGGLNSGGGGGGSVGGMQTMQMPPSMQGSGGVGGIYDHMQPSVNMNGVNMSPKTDQQNQNQFMQPPQNQFLQNRNTSSVSL